MIKISFEQKPYSYEAVGDKQPYSYEAVEDKQPYTITTEMTLDEDIDIYEAVRAFCRMLNIASYYVTADQIQNVANRLKEDYDNDRIL